MTKQWRVGTLSMGCSLLLLGIALLISGWQGLQAFDAMLKWWPVVLILLGLEIIMYLAVRGKEKPMLYYDVFSILFIGVLCCGALGFALLTSVGVMNEIRYAVNSEERSFGLQDPAEQVPADVKKVIVQTQGQNVKIDKTPQREVHLLGSYRAQAVPNQSGEAQRDSEAASFSSLQTIGDTMYIVINGQPRQSGLFRRSYTLVNATLVLPSDVQVEVRGWDNQKIEQKG